MKTNVECYAELAELESVHLNNIRYTDYGNRPGTLTEHKECERLITLYANKIIHARTNEAREQVAGGAL